MRKFLCPTDLAEAQALFIYELMEIIKVNKKKTLIFTIFQVIVPICESFNNI